MSDKIFIDTNLFVYALDKANPAKRDRCRAILRAIGTDGGGVVSTQVAQEFYVAAVQKLGCDPLAVKEIIQSLNRFEVVLVTMDTILEAVDCSILHRLSFWDALIVAAAISAGCSQIWTEDLKDGQVIRGVRIVNPLKPDAAKARSKH